MWYDPALSVPWFLAHVDRLDSSISCHMKKILALLILIGFAGVLSAELPFIPDNYPQALAQAKQRKQPIFVECWAPW